MIIITTKIHTKEDKYIHTTLRKFKPNLNYVTDMETFDKMVREIRSTFIPGKTLTRRETKNTLQSIYNKYRINSTAKASDLPLYGVNFRDTTVKNGDNSVNKHILLFN